MNMIVITGGSRGIGASAAEHAARRGMGVILTYNTHPGAAEGVVQRIEQAGGKAVALRSVQPTGVSQPSAGRLDQCTKH